MSEANDPETALERYIRFLGEVQECFEGANESDEWGDPETIFWQYRARTWAILAQSAATMCLAEATKERTT